MLMLIWALKCFQNTFISFLILSSPSLLSPFTKCRHTQFLWNPGCNHSTPWDAIQNLKWIREQYLGPAPHPRPSAAESRATTRHKFPVGLLEALQSQSSSCRRGQSTGPRVKIKARVFFAILHPNPSFPGGGTIRLSTKCPVVKQALWGTPTFQLHKVHAIKPAAEHVYNNDCNSCWVSCSTYNPSWSLPRKTLHSDSKMSNRN